MITFITYSLDKQKYEYLYKQGAQAILWYGWELISGNKDEEESWYKGAYLHKEDDKYEIVCKIDEKEKNKYMEDDLK